MNFSEPANQLRQNLALKPRKLASKMSADSNSHLQNSQLNEMFNASQMNQQNYLQAEKDSDRFNQPLLPHELPL